MSTGKAESAMINLLMNVAEMREVIGLHADSRTADALEALHHSSIEAVSGYAEARLQLRKIFRAHDLRSDEVRELKRKLAEVEKKNKKLEKTVENLCEDLHPPRPTFTNTAEPSKENQ